MFICRYHSDNIFDTKIFASLQWRTENQTVRPLIYFFNKKLMKNSIARVAKHRQIAWSFISDI